jgi:hypothetical protein
MPGLRLVHVFALQNQYERLLGSLNVLRTLQRLGVSSEGKVIITAFVLVRRSPFRMTPDPILKNLVPHKSATCSRRSRIGAHLCGIDCIWILGTAHGLGPTIQKLSDPAYDGVRSQSDRNGQVRCSARLVERRIAARRCHIFAADHGVVNRIGYHLLSDSRPTSDPLPTTTGLGLATFLVLSFPRSAWEPHSATLQVEPSIA